MVEKKLKTFLSSQRGRLIVTVLVYLLTLGIVLICMSSKNEAVLWGIYIACGYFGWKALGSFLDDIPEVNNIVFLLLLLLRLAVSILIGIFVMPLRIGEKIGDWAGSAIEIYSNLNQGLNPMASTKGSDGLFDPFAWALDDMNYQELSVIKNQCEQLLSYVWGTKILAYNDELLNSNPNIVKETEQRRLKEKLPEGTSLLGCETYEDVESLYFNVMARLNKMKV